MAAIGLIISKRSAVDTPGQRRTKRTAPEVLELFDLQVSQASCSFGSAPWLFSMPQQDFLSANCLLFAAAMSIVWLLISAVGCGRAAPSKRGMVRREPKYNDGIPEGRPSQHTNTDPANPMEPKDAPTASRPGTVRPLRVPSSPARFLCSFSWVSTRPTPAGKIAGKAGKSPPNPGPNFFAISPAITVRRVLRPLVDAGGALAIMIVQMKFAAIEGIASSTNLPTSLSVASRKFRGNLSCPMAI
jgi:hypothetical protein